MPDIRPFTRKTTIQTTRKVAWEPYDQDTTKAKINGTRSPSGGVEPLGPRYTEAAMQCKTKFIGMAWNATRSPIDGKETKTQEGAGIQWNAMECHAFTP